MAAGPILIGSRTEQETVLVVAVPGFPMMYARQIDVKCAVLGPGVGVFQVERAWVNKDEMLCNVESHGMNGATCKLAAPPPWWNERIGK